MTWAAYGPQKPSEDGIRRHDVSDAVDRAVSKTAGQGPVGTATKGRPQQDSNLRSRLRRPLLSPLSYGGWRLKRVSVNSRCPDTRRHAVSSDSSHRGTRVSGAALAPMASPDPAVPFALGLAWLLVRPAGGSCDRGSKPRPERGSDPQ